MKTVCSFRVCTHCVRWQDYNELRTKAGKAPVGFRLTGVEKVVNPVLEHRFALRHKAMKERAENKCSAEELRERFAFHGQSVCNGLIALIACEIEGTHRLNVAKICKTGLLRVGHELNPSNRVDEGLFAHALRLLISFLFFAATGFFGKPEHGIYVSRYVSCVACWRRLTLLVAG